MATGLTTLTLSLALGFAWTYRFRSFLGAGEPKTLWGVFIWAVILAALWARRGTGGERRGAVASTTAFVVIVLSYLVVRVVEGGGLFL